MSRKIIPFNVRILALTPEKLRGLKPVRVLDNFDGSTNNFHEDGLFSTSIFGKVGDELRNKRFSYIDIKIDVFHPIIYNTLVSLKRLYADIMSGKEYVLWDDQILDFVRSDPINGKTGFAYFMRYWDQIDHRRKAPGKEDIELSDAREQNILLLEKYKKIATTTKVVVMPAGLRDMEITQDGRMQCDEINTFYRKLLSISNTISEASIKHNPEIVDTSRLSLQLTFNELYNTIEAMIKGKKKLLLGKWASRRINNGTRNVITAMDTGTPYLGSEDSVSVNTTLVGLYQALKAIMPVARHYIRNGFLSKVFLSPNLPVRLVDKKTRKMVEVTLPTKYFDRWMTDEGVEKVLTSYADMDIRDKPLEIEGYYVGLIYKGPDGTFKIIQDIDSVPDTRNKQDVYPLTFCELLYISCYRIVDKYPALVTRYPIAGVGSIYPTFPHVKTTIKAEKRTELSDQWDPIDEQHVAYEFPTKGPHFDSLSPHSIKLVGAAADFDGDMMSYTALYADESVSEIKDYLSSRRAYVGSDGQFIASTNVSTVALVLHNLTG